MRLLPTLFDRYVMRTLFWATFVTALSLTLLILLTQSIRYLELVIASGASPTYFLIMIGYAIPKFLEAILPLAFAIGAIYTAHRLKSDREIIIMAAAGSAVQNFGRGFMIFAALMMGVQFALSGWISPFAVSNLQETRADIKSHYATLMFREGVFNNIGGGLTAFVEARIGMNELQNLMIHDDEGMLNSGKATTILAKRGIVNLNGDNQQLLIYNGTQYQQDLQSEIISRLDFDQYTLDIPAQETAITNRWKDPDERTFDKLLATLRPSSDSAGNNPAEFHAEIHKRISTPFLYAVFVLLILVFMFLGPWNRRKQTAPLIKAAIAIIAIQALHIVFFNEAKDHIWMNLGMYSIIFIPIILCYGRMAYHARG